jgi:DNA-binding LytR/AlgR family response regulator
VINGTPNRWTGTGIRVPPLAIVLVAIAAFVPVEATTTLMEAARNHQTLAWWAPFVWQGSSAIVMMLLAPVIGAAATRWPMPRGARIAQASIHAGLTVPVSLAHVGGMVALRKLAYAAQGFTYVFATSKLPRELLYEWRKDALTYALVAATFWVFLRLQAPSSASGPARSEPQAIEIRDGARRIFVRPTEVLWIEAAGNYVELHTLRDRRLVRGVLNVWEARLAPYGFARIHRSRLVNCAHVRSVRATDAKDLAITLDGGAQVGGSRRFRETFEAALKSLDHAANS